MALALSTEKREKEGTGRKILSSFELWGDSPLGRGACLLDFR